MNCENCGQHLDPFGDDQSMAAFRETTRLGSGLVCVSDNGNLTRAQAVCPNCGHIQDACRPTVNMKDGD